MKTIFIIGDGNMAETLYSYLYKEYHVAAFCVEKKYRRNNELFGIPVIDMEYFYSKNIPEVTNVCIAIGAVKLNLVRERLYNILIKKKYNIISYFAKTNIKHLDSTFDNGSIILENTTVHYGSKIGKNVFIASGVNIGHRCIIKDNVWINSGVTIAGNVVIGQSTFIGVGATIANGVEIGGRTFIGGGTYIDKSKRGGCTIIRKESINFSVDSDTFVEKFNIL